MMLKLQCEKNRRQSPGDERGGHHPRTACVSCMFYQVQMQRIPMNCTGLGSISIQETRGGAREVGEFEGQETLNTTGVGELHISEKLSL